MAKKKDASEGICTCTFIDNSVACPEESIYAFRKSSGDKNLKKAGKFEI